MADTPQKETERRIVESKAHKAKRVPWGMSLFLSLSCMLTWTVYEILEYVTVLIVMYVDMDCL